MCVSNMMASRQYAWKKHDVHGLKSLICTCCTVIRIDEKVNTDRLSCKNSQVFKPETSLIKTFEMDPGFLWLLSIFMW